MMKTSQPIPAESGRGSHLMAAIAKQAQEGLTIRKALSLREDVDKELDALSKEASAEHGIDYFTAYSRVTSEGVGKSLMETSLGLSNLIASPTRMAD